MHLETRKEFNVTCQRPWVTDRYFLRTSSGSLSPITVSELKSRSRRRSRATSPATAGRSLSPTECPCRPTTTPVSVWGCRLTESTSPRSTRRIGLDAGFVAVTWFGNEGQVGWGSKVVTFNYYGNVQNAFETAPHYKLAMDVPTCRTVPIQRKTNSDGYTVRLFSALVKGQDNCLRQ